MLRFFLHFVSVQLVFSVINSETVDEYLERVTLDINSQYRIPQNVLPRVYNIELDPDFLNDHFTFSGKGKFHIEVIRPTMNLIIHKAATLDITSDSVKLTDKNGKSIIPNNLEWISDNEFYQISFDTKLDRGNYILNLEWKGRDATNDWLLSRIGFFRAVNVDEDLKKSYLVTTHFEAEGARSAFPCWDEPGIKAKFEISIKHFSNYTALSNMPVKNTKTLSDGRVLTQFKRTPNMSTYLVCWLVANYSSIQNSNGKIKFYGVPNRVELLRTALNASEAVVDAMEKYTGIPYPLPKLDQMSIPQYVGYGMEHWGITSYWTNVMEDQKTSLIPNFPREELITYVITHETTHQWIGNLVTKKWWGDKWMNEAITVYFEYKVMNMIQPKWRKLDIMAVQQLNEEAFEADVDAKHPVRWNPKNKLEIIEVFTGVTYAKGAGIVQMFDFALTNEVFQDGIRRYLLQHEYQSTETADILNNFQEAYNQSFPNQPLNMKEFMDPWLVQIGYPILTVERDYKTGKIKVCQSNFRTDLEENQWTIPITYSSKSKLDFSKTLPKIWMSEKCMSINDVSKNDWIIINNQQRGFYRVKYDTKNWQMLIDFLNSNQFKKIHPINRAQLIYDYYRIYKEQDDALETLISLIHYLHQEVNDLPWIPGKTFIKDMKKKLDNTKVEKTFYSYVRYLFDTVITKIGFKYRMDENYSDTRLRYSLTELACDFKHPGCQAHAEDLFNEFLKNPSPNAFPDDDWKWVLCYGLRRANETTWDKFIQGDIQNIPSSISKFNYIRCSQDVNIRWKYLMRSMKRHSTLNAREVYDMFQSFLDGDNENFNFIIHVIIEKFNKIEKFYEDKQDDINMLTLISRISQSTKCSNQYDKWKMFLESNLENLKGKYDNKILIENFEVMENSLNNSKIISKKFEDVLKKKIKVDTIEDC